MRRTLVILIPFLAAALLLGGCDSNTDQADASSANASTTIVVGSTNFPEQLVLANLYADALEAHGYKVKRRLNLGSREIVFPALKSGEIDVLPEYTGALASYLSGQLTPSQDADAVADALSDALPDELVMLQISPAQDKDALVVTQKTANKLDLETISDLQGHAGSMVIGGPPELKSRADGLPGLASVYGLTFQSFRALDAGGPLTVSALAGGDIDVARMFSTQGVIEARDWVVLEDDKDLVPAQNIVPIVRRDVVDDRLQAVLDHVSAALTTADLRHMNRTVNSHEADPSQVAAKWLEAHQSEAQ